jgi:hypothetical protein
MTYRNFLTLAAILGFLFGLGFLLMPLGLTALYGITLGTAGSAAEFVARLFGIELLGLATLTWLMRGVGDPAARRAVNFANILANGLGFVISTWYQISGTAGTNALGWSTVAIYLLLALGFAYFEFMQPSRAAVRPI